MISVAIIAIGTELTEGIIQDSHGRYIASQLHRMGYSTRSCRLVPDDPQSIREALKQTIGHVDILIVTGGLGPTADDITSQVLADFVEKELVFHQRAWEAILNRFAGQSPPDTNRKQACFPDGFLMLENSLGTAPGFHGREAGTRIFCLPGPPREMMPILQQQVIPLLNREFGRAAAADELGASVYATSESQLDSVLMEVQRTPGFADLSWGTRIDEGRIVLTLRSGGQAFQEEALRLAQERLGPRWVKRGDIRPVETLFRALRDRGESLAVAESCTGGMLSKELTDIPGSSDVFRGGCVTYSNDSKIRILGVESRLIQASGAVSQEVVEAMADASAALFQADYGVGISGIAGPSGGTDEKPVGTVWIAVKGKHEKAASERFLFAGSRGSVRRKAAAAAAILAEEYVVQKRFCSPAPSHAEAAAEPKKSLTMRKQDNIL